MTKILVVDDDPRNLRLAVAVLEKAGYEVLAAGGGAEGVDMATAHLPDMILMDVLMPRVDGIAALKRLRGDPRTAAIKVAALTALAMQGDRERLLAEGFDTYMSKPIHYKLFLASVAALLGGEASR